MPEKKTQPPPPAVALVSCHVIHHHPKHDLEGVRSRRQPRPTLLRARDYSYRKTHHDRGSPPFFPPNFLNLGASRFLLKTDFLEKYKIKLLHPDEEKKIPCGRRGNHNENPATKKKKKRPLLFIYFSRRFWVKRPLVISRNNFRRKVLTTSIGAHQKVLTGEAQPIRMPETFWAQSTPPPPRGVSN